MKLERNDSKESPMTPQEEIERIVRNHWDAIRVRLGGPSARLTDKEFARLSDPEFESMTEAPQDDFKLATRAYTAGQQSRDAELDREREEVKTLNQVNTRAQLALQDRDARIAELEAQLKASDALMAETVNVVIRFLKALKREGRLDRSSEKQFDAFIKELQSSEAPN
jgi:hypothetical protein